MKFKYHKFNLSPSSVFFGKYILKPIIPVKILKADTVLQYAALIDSGADFCIFDAGLGEYLGLSIKSGMEIQFGGIQSLGGALEVFNLKQRWVFLMISLKMGMEF